MDNQLKTLALLRGGYFEEFNCDKCTEEMRESRNCHKDESREDTVVYHPMVGELTMCPLRYIEGMPLIFIDKYDYYEKYPGAAPKYEECDYEFWQLVKKYSAYTNDVYKLDKEKDKAKPSEGEIKSQLNTLFNKENKDK